MRTKTETQVCRPVRVQLHQATCSALLPGEQEAIDKVIRAAREYGHGNMIAWLRRDWAEILRDRWDMNEKAAVKSTQVTPYPLRKARQWPKAPTSS